MKEYHGWTMKIFYKGESWLSAWSYHMFRSGVINFWGREDYFKDRRKGECLAVKVKLVEVE